jgi:hypothetical protein
VAITAMAIVACIKWAASVAFVALVASCAVGACSVISIVVVMGLHLDAG